MMESKYIGVVTIDRVMRIGFNRPDKKNAITNEMYEAMRSALRFADDSDSVRVVIIHGLADCFTAGNDLADFNTRKSTGVSSAVNFLLELHAFRKPLIASVSGLAVGIGTTLLLHCDIVYAAVGTRFRLPFVNLGLCPEAGSSLLLPAAAGPRTAAELLMFGDFFTTEIAVTAGLVSQVISPDELSVFSQKRAVQLAEQPVTALIESKRLLKSQTFEQTKQRILDESVIFGELLQSEESIAARDRALGSRTSGAK